MLSKAHIKYIQLLKNRKNRQQFQSFIVEGEKSVSELLESSLVTSSVYATAPWKAAYQHLPALKNCEVTIISQQDLQKISDLTTPNQVLAIARIPEADELNSTDFNEPVIALDSIRDPGNLGTIARTADWFGIRNIVCSPDCVDFFNPKVIQSTMGSFVRVKVHYKDLTAFLGNLPSHTQYMVLCWTEIQ